MNPEATILQLPNYRRIELWAAVVLLVFLVVLVEAVRRRRLKERYSLLWFASVAVLITLTVKRDWLEAIAYGLGIHYPPNALFLILVGFTIAILFHYSTVVSRLLDDRTVLAQRMGLLEAQLGELQREVARCGGGDSAARADAWAGD